MASGASGRRRGTPRRRGPCRRVVGQGFVEVPGPVVEVGRLLVAGDHQGRGRGLPEAVGTVGPVVVGRRPVERRPVEAHDEVGVRSRPTPSRGTVGHRGDPVPPDADRRRPRLRRRPRIDAAGAPRSGRGSAAVTAAVPALAAARCPVDGEPPPVGVIGPGGLEDGSALPGWPRRWPRSTAGTPVQSTMARRSTSWW